MNLVILLTIVLPGMYFANVRVQTLLGRQALAATGLTSLPLEAALKKAGAESKLVLVNVSAIWCPYCRLLDNKVFADAKVKKVMAAGYVFCRLEYESASGKTFLKQQKAEGFPNLWVLNPDGTTIQHLEVTFKPEEFIEQIKY